MLCTYTTFLLCIERWNLHVIFFLHVRCTALFGEVHFFLTVRTSAYRKTDCIRINCDVCTTLIKKFPEFIQKIQNTSFIHQKWYCPLQSTPHRLQRTYVSAWSSSRNISVTLLSVAIRAVFDFSITSFRFKTRSP